MLLKGIQVVSYGGVLVKAPLFVLFLLSSVSQVCAARLRFATLDWDGWDWSTLAKGKAKDREFDSDHRGINNYYNIAEEDPSKVEGLYITVYASERQRDSLAKLLLPLSKQDPQGDNPLNASATAMLALKRPDEGFGHKREEYGCLYNPFWEPKLVNQNNVVGL